MTSEKTTLWMILKSRMTNGNEDNILGEVFTAKPSPANLYLPTDASGGEVSDYISMYNNLERILQKQDNERWATNNDPTPALSPYRN